MPRFSCRFDAAITEFIEWQAFAYWVRLVVEIEGGISTKMQSLLEERLHLGRYTALNLDHQTNPICEGLPLNEFRNRGVKSTRKPGHRSSRSDCILVDIPPS